MARVVIVGYGEMLYSLIEGVIESKNKIVGVFRNDRVQNSSFNLFFKDIFNPSKDYTIIKSHKLYDIKAHSVNSEKFRREIKKLKADLIIVGSWGEKFKKDILDFIPCINFHPALLPKNRGANPYFWAIYNNQTVTGLTIHFMNEKFDSGDILLQEAVTISEAETGRTLKDKICRLARPMVGDLLKLYNSNQLQPIKQDETFATYEPQLTEREVIINLNQPKTDVDRHLRALYPWANPYVKVGRRYFKIIRYKLLPLTEKEASLKPYQVVENNNDYFILKGSDFLIEIEKV